MVTTYGDLYLDLKKQLRSLNVAAAEQEARELVCAAAGKTLEQFFRDKALYAPEEVADRANALLRRRTQGEPLPYILGRWEFMGLPIELTRNVLIPRVDTEVLAHRAIELVRERPQCRVLDLCCGSGCIGISVAASVESSRVVLADVSEEVLRVARANCRLNGVTGRANCLRLDVRAGEPEAIGLFDVICCNPPYIPTGDLDSLDDSVRKYEPRSALDGGADGLDFYRAVIENFRSSLKKGGYLLFEVGIGQARQVEQLLLAGGFFNVEILNDTADIQRVVTAQYF